MIKQRTSLLYVLISAVLFGIVPLFSRYAYQDGLTPITVTFYRGLLPLGFLYLAGKNQKQSFKLTKQQLGAVVLVGLFGNTLTNLTLNMSYLYIPIGTATTLHFMYPFMVSILCFYFFKQRLTKVQMIALILALIGLWLMVEQLSGSVWGIALALFSSISYAFYMVMVERKRLNQINTIVLTFYLSAVVAGSSLILSIMTSQFAIPTSLSLWGNLLMIACLAQLLGVAFLQLGIKKVGALLSSMISLAEPLTSVIVGTLFLTEPLTLRKILGFIIISIAMFVFVFVKTQPKNK